MYGNPIEIPDELETYLHLTKEGYYWGLASYLPGDDEDQREALLLDESGYVFADPTAEGSTLMGDDYTDAHKVRPEKVRDLVKLLGYTFGVSPHTYEPYHVSEFKQFIDHAYDENSPYYPQEGQETA